MLSPAILSDDNVTLFVFCAQVSPAIKIFLGTDSLSIFAV